MGLLLGSGTTKPQYPYDQWYGVQGDFTSKDKNLVRVGNLDLHRTLPEAFCREHGWLGEILPPPERQS